MRKTVGRALAGLFLALMLGACGAGAVPERETAPAPAQTEAASPVPVSPEAERPPESPKITEEEEKTMLHLTIGETPVAVDWEENPSVEALRELCREGALTLSLSMYGGFEQVGPIGTPLPRSDEQTRTVSGDIVLYAGDQIVIFYGSNSWAYTRLGHISDRSEADMADLLGRGDVTITLSLE